VKVLTVRQPWAWAIVHAGKDVENRPRNVAGGYQGPLAIQAGLSFSDDWPLVGPLQDAFTAADKAGHRMTGRLNEVFDLGVIIGVVDLVGVHDSSECVTGLIPHACSPWADPNRKHLELVNPRPLSTPITWSGSLSMRDLPEGVEADILRQIGQV
jgi:hypothetical protein